MQIAVMPRANITSHAYLSGLLVDDHTQYIHKDGRAGGQILIGGSLTTQGLTLRANAADLTTGQVNVSNTLEASSTTIGSLAVAGGLAVAKRVYALDMTITNTITGGVSGNAGTVTNGVYTNAANSMSLINPLTTLAESWIGPSSTTGIYFKGGNLGIGTTGPGAKLSVVAGEGYGVNISSSGNYSYNSLDISNTQGDYQGFRYQASGGNGNYIANNVLFDDSRPATAGSVGSFFTIYRSGSLVTGNILQVGNTTAASDLVVSNTGNVGIGTTSPTNLVSLGGNSARTMWMERHTTADTAGNSLTVRAGGATVGATNKNGGDVIVSGAGSTGTGASGVQLQGCVAGGAGTGDNSFATMLQILGNRVGVFGVTPVVRPTALTTALTTLTFTAPGTPDYAIADFTQTTPWGFASQDEARTVMSVIANLQTRVGEINTKLQALGLLT